MNPVYVGLGSNQGNTRRILSNALSAIAALPHTRIDACSRPWRTPPWGEPNQPAFLNIVTRLECGLAPLPLLDALLDIEQRLGRRRNNQRWGPRTIDTDILLYAQRIVRHPRLQLPHPHMHDRAFVLCPLLELNAEVRIPGHGTAAACLSRLDSSDHYAADFTLFTPD